MAEEKREIRLKPIDEKVSINSLPDLAALTNCLWMRWLKDNRAPYFGTIIPIFKSEAFNYSIVEFYPHSAETEKKRKASYQTTGEAIDACMKFLEEKGYSAKIFDLESWLSRV
jgi:hypothetical protein